MVKNTRVRQILTMGALAVLLGVAGAPAEAQKPPSTAPAKPARTEAVNRLTIEVTGGDDNRAIENASVYVKYVQSRLLRDKKMELNVKTNRDGVAHIPDAPLGRVLIQVIAEGWKTYGRWYDVTGPKQDIKIHLERPPKWY